MYNIVNYYERNMKHFFTKGLPLAPKIQIGVTRA